MNDLRDTIITIFLVALLMTVQVYGVLSSRTYQLSDEVTAIRLGRGCELWYFPRPAQPVDTFALACPRMDLIRLWPLPVMQPWIEDEGNTGTILSPGTSSLPSTTAPDRIFLRRVGGGYIFIHCMLMEHFAAMEG